MRLTGRTTSAGCLPSIGRLPKAVIPSFILSLSSFFIYCSDASSLTSRNRIISINNHLPLNLALCSIRYTMPGYTRESAALWVPIALEIALAALGFWTLWGFPYKNGLLAILKSQTEAGAMIPGPTAAPMRQTYTGIGPVDNQLTILVSFFYTAIDGNRGDVSLSFFGLGGHVLASWVLITIESLRSGNKSKWFLTA